MAITDGVVSLKYLVIMETLSNEGVLGLIRRGVALKTNKADFSLDRQYFVANLLFEPSTRTHKSFEVAERKLGLDVIEFDAKTSSVDKGEILYDTILTTNSSGIDICVIHHSMENYYKGLTDSRTIQTVIMNGGDGSGQYLSQCLLDLMTIYEKFGGFKNLKVAIVGNIIHSCVAKSNMQTLKRLGAELYFTGPEQWYSSEFDVYGKYVVIDDIVDKVDVMMMLRVQHERHDSERGFSKETYHKTYGLIAECYEKMKTSATIMHPAPVNRDVEIADQLVETPKSRIATQMQNGVFVRMVILEAVLNGKAQRIAYSSLKCLPINVKVLP